MARANWSEGYFQAAIYHHLLEELGYDVNDPADREMAPGDFYPALARGEVDLWANSWYPLDSRNKRSVLPDGSVVGDNLEIVGEVVGELMTLAEFGAI